MLNVIGRNNFGNNSHTNLLVQSFNKTNGSTNFTDTSRGGITHIITAEGGASHTTSLAKFGNSSIDTSSTTKYLTTPSSSDLHVVNKLSADGWFRLSATSNFPGIFCLSNSNGQDRWALFFRIINEEIAFLAEVDDSIEIYSLSKSINLDTWYHYCVSVDVTNSKVWLHLDGIYYGEIDYTSGQVLNANDKLYIGQTVNNVGALLDASFYLDQMRIRQGEVYPKRNFTPPNRPY